MKMKVALCLSGQMRDFDKYYQSYIDKIIDPYNADVFLHTWSSNIEREKLCLEIFKPKEYIIENFDSLNIINNSEIFDLNKKILSERNVKTSISDSFIPQLCGTPENIYGMYFSMKKSNDLKKELEIKNNFKYDIVFRTRMDLFFQSNFYFNYENKIILPKNAGGWGNDHFAYGPSNLIDFYQLYDYINEYIKDDLNILHPETLLRHHLTLNNIPHNYIRFNYLIRGIYQK